MTVATGAVVAPSAQPAAAIEQPDTVNLDGLNMVPERMWGVSGQNPADTQTQSLDNLVWDFAQIGNRMFVGGTFLNVQENKNATPIVQSYVAAFDIDSGDWVSSWTPQIDRGVYSLEVLPNGSLLVGGEFESVNGVARQGVVALDPLTGAIDPSFTGSVDRPWSTLRAVVRDLEVDGDLVYVAGNFSHLDGINGSRTRVYKAGRFNPAGVIDPTWKPEITGSGVWGLDTDVARNEVALAGFFSAVNGEANTGNFHTVDATTGASVPGMLDLPRNLPNAQPEMFDVTYGDGTIFAIGEQHIIQVLDINDQAMLGYHHTGIGANGFTPSGYFGGGAYQFGERIGDIVFAGCHCTYSIRNGNVNHYSSFTGQRTPNRLVMAYDASTGRIIDSFMPDIHSPRDGTWAAASDTNGCLYIGGDLHVGGVDAGTPRWVGGFAKFCGAGPRVDGLLIEAGSEWRYDDSGADLGTAWREPGFNDAGWAAGNGELGFGDGDEATVIAAGNVTYYARKTFDFNGTLPPSLDLRLKADDGAVVYLNGVEIARDNLPDGQITSSTPASGWRSGSSEDFMEHVVRADSLVQGQNVLAVEIHNVWSGNNDLGFDVRLGAADQVVEIPEEPLVEIGSTWNYVDAGNDAPAGWPGAVVGGPAASAQMGFGEGDEATTLTAGQEAYYFSHEFQVADAAAIGQLKLSLLADDGAVVFLNGTELYRYNMPDGPIGFGTRPINWVGTADEIYMDYTVPAAALVNGTNLLTVEVHNFWPGNPDLSFDAGLEVQP
jgi:hypothetical protein